MENELIVSVRFDYGDIPKEFATKGERLREYVLKDFRNQIGSISSAGGHISDWRDTCDILGNMSLFKPWVESLGVCMKTAQNYIRVYEFSKTVKSIESYSLNSILTLTANDVPKIATKKAEKIAAKGKPVTQPVAKDLAKKAKADQVDSGPDAPDPEEEPVDEPEPAAKPAKPSSAKGKAVANPTLGLFDGMEKSAGQIIRGIDAVASHRGGQGNRHAACMDSINSFLADMKTYRKGGK